MVLVYSKKNNNKKGPYLCSSSSGVSSHLRKAWEKSIDSLKALVPRCPALLPETSQTHNNYTPKHFRDSEPETKTKQNKNRAKEESRILCRGRGKRRSGLSPESEPWGQTSPWPSAESERFTQTSAPWLQAIHSRVTDPRPPGPHSSRRRQCEHLITVNTERMFTRTRRVPQKPRSFIPVSRKAKHSFPRSVEKYINK